MKTVAYLKASEDGLEIDEQKQTILDFAQREKIILSQVIEIFPSSERFTKEEKIALLLGQLESGDTLILSDLRRIGRSASEIIIMVDTLVKSGVRFVAIKESIHLNRDNQDLESQVMVKMLELFAQIEHERLSQRRMERLVVPKARGRSGGRPRTDPEKLEQATILYENSNQTAAEVCQTVGVGRRTFFKYLSEKRKQRIAAMADEND
jgi:DNA invertase Pin-like site-specific DNA recombinase